MAPLQWDESYSVGNAVLDAQHREVIDLINMLDDETLVEVVLEQLERYAREHFRDEERLMEEAGYPALAEHRALHAAFAEWLAGMQKACLAPGVAPLLRDDIRAYLENWLIEHILVEDMAYRPYVS